MAIGIGQPLIPSWLRACAAGREKSNHGIRGNRLRWTRKAIGENTLRTSIGPSSQYNVGGLSVPGPKGDFSNFLPCPAKRVSAYSVVLPGRQLGTTLEWSNERWFGAQSVTIRAIRGQDRLGTLTTALLLPRTAVRARPHSPRSQAARARYAQPPPSQASSSTSRLSPISHVQVQGNANE